MEQLIANDLLEMLEGYMEVCEQVEISEEEKKGRAGLTHRESVI